MQEFQKVQHFISIDAMTRETLELLLRSAHHLKENGINRKDLPLRGRLLANLFFEPSTRSRLSFAAAFQRLGGGLLEVTDVCSSSLSKGESLEDTSRIISSYADIMVVRHPEQGALERFASTATIPVISSGDGTGEHPTQALLDLFTILEEKKWSFNQLEGRHIALIGDLKNGRTIHSLLKILLLAAGDQKLTFYAISPEPLGLPDSLLKLALQKGHQVIVSSQLGDALAQAEILYTTRIQEERFPPETSKEELFSYRSSFQLTRALYEQSARPHTPILHPLPRDSRTTSCEIATDLDEHPQLAIFRQAANGIPVRMALFLWLLGVSVES